MSRIELPSKSSSETQNAIFDFTSMLAVSETILTAVVAATVFSGTDASPSSLISGTASISGQKVTQAITAGTTGVLYNLECLITTSAGQTLQLGAYLAVVDNLP